MEQVTADLAGRLGSNYIGARLVTEFQLYLVLFANPRFPLFIFSDQQQHANLRTDHNENPYVSNFFVLPFVTARHGGVRGWLRRNRKQSSQQHASVDAHCIANPS
jgi:hypothetical protein